MSALLLKANELNQRFTALFYKTTPISYDPEKVSWNYEGNLRKLLPYFIINCVCTVGGGALGTIFLIPFTFFITPEQYRTEEKVIVAILIGALIPIAIYVNYLLLHHGREIVAVNNWAVKTRRRYRIPPYSNPKLSLLSLMEIELQKHLRGIQLDWFGLFAVFAFGFLTVLTLIAPFAIAYLKLDIWRLLLKAFSHISLTFFDSDFGISQLDSYFLVKVLIYTADVVVFASVGITWKILLIFGSPLLQFLLQLFQHLRQVRLTNKGLSLYKEGLVAGKIMHSTMKLLLGAYLGMAFHILLLFITVSLLGYRLLPWNFYVLLPPTALATGWVLLMLFYFGCKIYETSGEALFKWRRQILKIGLGNRREMTRILRSLRPFAFPVGEVGIMDNNIKINYLSTLQGSLVTVLIVTQDYFV